MAQMKGSTTKGFQLLTTAGGDWGSDIELGEGTQVPQRPAASDLLRRGAGQAQQFWQLVLKGATVVSWSRNVACVSDHPGDSHGALSETRLTKCLDVIRAPRESIQAYRGWTLRAKEPLKVHC